MRLALLLSLVILSTGCLHHRQKRMEREWQSIWEGWQEEVNDDCDYINNFKKQDCVQRHTKKL